MSSRQSYLSTVFNDSMLYSRNASEPEGSTTFEKFEIVLLIWKFEMIPNKANYLEENLICFSKPAIHRNRLLNVLSFKLRTS